MAGRRGPDVHLEGSIRTYIPAYFGLTDLHLSRMHDHGELALRPQPERGRAFRRATTCG